MNYAQMTAHQCKTVFQPCFDPSMLVRFEVADDGYRSTQVNAPVIWQCLVDHGQLCAAELASRLGTTHHIIGLYMVHMKKNGNVTATKKTKSRASRYTATMKSPPQAPVYAVRSVLKRNPGATVAGLCALSNLYIDQVRAGIKQLINENLVSIHATYPKTYSLKGTQ